MGQVVAITSGKGGVGKSTFCCTIGRSLAKKNQRTVIIEMDFGMRGLDMMLNVANKIVYDLGDLFTNQCRLNDIIVPVQSNLSLIGAPMRYDVPMEIKDMVVLLSSIKQHFDFILIDSPAGFGLPFEVVKLVSDRILVVAEPDLITIRDANNVVRELLEVGYKDFFLIINKVDAKVMKDAGVKDLDFMIDEIGAQLLGVIPYDGDFSRRISQGKLPSPKSLTYQAYENITRRLLGEYVPLAIQ